MTDKVALRIGGKDYGGWKTVKVTCSIEALAGSFSLSVTDRWSSHSQPWPIRRGDECTVLINDVPMLTGFVDVVAPKLGSGERSISVEGRDRACDVVDSSAQLGAWSFTNVSVLALAQKICAPYKVSVSLQAGLNPAKLTIPKKYSIDPGDTAARALQNVCKVAGLLAVSDGNGNIVLTRAGRERLATTIVEGRNLKSGSARYDATSLFHRYEVMGSHKGRDDLSGEAAAGVKGSAVDENVRSSRVTIIRPDANMTTALAKQRAEWEATVRSAQANSVKVSVPGWQESQFEPVWPRNKLVRVKSPTLQVDGFMLITGTTFTMDVDGGAMTSLDLRPPMSFLPDPTIVKVGGGGGNNYWKEIEHGVS